MTKRNKSSGKKGNDRLKKETRETKTHKYKPRSARGGKAELHFNSYVERRERRGTKNIRNSIREKPTEKQDGEVTALLLGEQGSKGRGYMKRGLLTSGQHRKCMPHFLRSTRAQRRKKLHDASNRNSNLARQKSF